MDAVIGIVILIMSVVVHEVSHGYAAQALGDPTARLAGRLTLNPLKHLDPIGSVAVPLLTFFSGGFIFGWAKPVPYNPYNLRKGKWSEAYVALAGPLSNIALATIFGLLIRFGGGAFSEVVLGVFATIVLINIILAIFNLIPVPPLDGSKVLFAFLPPHLFHVRGLLERWGFILIIIVILFLWKLLTPLIAFLFHLATGIGL